MRETRAQKPSRSAATLNQKIYIIKLQIHHAEYYVHEIRASEFLFFIKLHTICLPRRNRIASSLPGFFSDHYSTIIDRTFQYATGEIFAKNRYQILI